jgi:hypothetical protein
MTQTFAPALFDHGSVGTGTTTPEIGKGLYHRITCTAATRTIADPVRGIRESPGPPPSNVVTVPVVGTTEVGTVLFLEVKATGGALTITFGSAYKGPATAIANGFRRIFPFIFDGLNWVLANGASDAAN